jgi:hypothetical protein
VEENKRVNGREKELNNKGGKEEDSACVDEAQMHDICPQINKQHLGMFSGMFAFAFAS